MAVDDLYRLTIQIETPGSCAEINLGYEMTSGTNEPYTLENATADAIAVMNTQLIALLAADTFIRRYTMVPITDPLDVIGYTDLDASVGTVVGDALPANICGVISLPTDAPNSKHNGRIYISGVSEEAQDEGVMDAGQMTLMDAFAAKLNDTLDAGTPGDAIFTPAVISYVEDGVPRVPPVGFTVGTPIAKSTLRQQRRRKTAAFGAS